MKYIFFWIIFIPLAAVAFFAVRYVVRKTNEQIAWDNEQIAQNNEAISRQNEILQQRYDEVTKRLAELKEEMIDSTSSWYPKNYYSLYAINFFIDAIENFRADNVKEMVNLFEATEEQKEMVRRQEEINRSLKQQTLNQERINSQLQFANVLNVAGLFMQAGIQNSIDANTSAIGNNTNAVNKIYKKLF